MEHNYARIRARQPDYAGAAPAVSTLTRTAVFRVHVLLWLQSKQRRIQADGTCPLREAQVSRFDHETSDRYQGRRQLLARHAVFQLLPGPDDDERQVPPVVRKPSTRARVEPGSAAHGSRGEHSVGYRGSVPEDGRIHPP